MAQYPLRFGMSTVAWFGDEGFPHVNEYRADPGRQYDVRVAAKTGNPSSGGLVVGTATVGGGPDSWWVEFDTSESNPRFYSIWHVDGSGIANLHEVLLITDRSGD
jgi:hypothetical protein